MPKFFTKGSGKERKVIPITPRTKTIKPINQFRGYNLSLTDIASSAYATHHLHDEFVEAGLMGDRKQQLAIKRAMVSAANKARAQGHPEVAEVYEKAHKRMVLIKPITQEKVVAGGTQQSIKNPNPKWFITLSKDIAIKYADGRQIYQLPNGAYVTKLRSKVENGVVTAPPSSQRYSVNKTVPTDGPVTLYIYNLDSKGRPKAYGQTHPNKASAEKHLANLKDYYGDRFGKEVLGTKFVEGTGKGLSSNQIIKKYFTQNLKHNSEMTPTKSASLPKTFRSRELEQIQQKVKTTTDEQALIELRRDAHEIWYNERNFGANKELEKEARRTYNEINAKIDRKRRELDPEYFARIEKKYHVK